MNLCSDVPKLSLPVCTQPDTWTPPEEGPLFHCYQCLKFWIFQWETTYVLQSQSKCKLRVCEILICRIEKPAAMPWFFESLSKCCSYSSVEYFTARDSFWRGNSIQFSHSLESCHTVCHLLLCLRMVVLFATSTVSPAVHRRRWKEPFWFWFPSSTSQILSSPEPRSTEVYFVSKQLLSLKNFKNCTFR